MAKVQLEEVRFQFPGSKAIRLDRREGVALTSPEWTRSGPSEPAAYVKPAAGGALKLRAVFSCSDPGVKSAQVSAQRISTGTHTFGDIATATVKFTNGLSKAVTFRINGTFTIIALEQVTWQWRVKLGGAWTAIDLTQHDLALILQKPKEPWVVTKPWWDLLAHACTRAAGAATPADASSRLSAALFNSGLFTYDSVAQNYATDVGINHPAFDALTFLARLDGQAAPPAVDCSDVSSMVSTLSAILGCGLSQFVVTGDDTNPVHLIGSNGWTSQFFGLHEFAVRGATSHIRIWDPCLQVSGDTPIKATPPPPTTAFVPAELKPKDYLFRLLASPPEKLADIVLRGHLVRPVGALPSEIKPVVLDAYLNGVAKAYGFDTWPLPPKSSLLKPGFDVPPVAGWTITGRPPRLDDKVRKGFERVVRLLWRGPDRKLQLLAADIYICASVKAARLRLVAVLGGFKRTRLNKVEPLAANEVMFETPDKSAIAGSFRNVVLVIRRASVGGENWESDVKLFRDALFRTLNR